MRISNAKFDPSPRPLPRKKGVGERQLQPLQVDEKEAERRGRASGSRCAEEYITPAASEAKHNSSNLSTRLL